MLSIGEFSKICNVSTKTLRYYAEIGLILPDEINNENGYRYYSIEQLETMLFIKRLKSKGVRLGVVTSDSVKSAQITIEYFGWEDLFEVVIGRESCEYTKESGKPTILAIERLNANCKNTIMIGDAPMDYISAQNAGLKATILVASGQIGVSELCKTSDFVVGSLNEVSIN